MAAKDRDGEGTGGLAPGGGGVAASAPARLPPQAFTAEVLETIQRVSEPRTAAEAELAGPWWAVRSARQGEYDVVRRGDLEAGIEPLARFSERQLALLAAAALPAVGRAPAFRVVPEARDGRYPILREGEAVGSLDVFLADLAPALDLLIALMRSPAALALLLEAAGGTALQRAGRELALRLGAPGDEADPR